MHETVYPRFKSSISEKELTEIYTPTQEEIKFSRKVTRGENANLCFLIMLKSFQRLGYFVPLANIPNAILQHISKATNIVMSMEVIENYNKSGTRLRHVQVIREYLNIKPYDGGARHVIVRAIGAAAKTKDEPSDLINVAIEELIRQHYELPAFSTLIRASNRIRVSVYRSFYRQINTQLCAESRNKIDKILESEQDNIYTSWNFLKQEPGTPTLMHLRDLVSYLRWLSIQNVGTEVLSNIPDVKIKQFAAEAKTLNAAQMKALEPNKRYTLAVALLAVQSAKALDDLAEMFIKRMSNVHRKGKEALELYRAKNIQMTDKLVVTLRDMILAYKKDGSIEERFAAIKSVIEEKSDEVLSHCEAHTAHAGNNYYAFLWKYFKSHRVTLFGILKTVTLNSTSQDVSLEQSLKFLQSNESTRKELLNTVRIENKGKANENKIQLLDLSWVHDDWWKLITGYTNRNIYPDKINRRHFEVCVFTQIMMDLKSGDLYVKGSDKFSDYRDQLISWEEYEETKELYGRQAGLPVDSHGFVDHVKNWLNTSILNTDKSFTSNQYLKIEKGVPTLGKPEKKKYPEQLRLIESLISERLKPINILDVITDTEYWLNWTKAFGSISGQDTKIENPIERYLITSFCYGCNLGPTQTFRSLEIINRKQVAWINNRHITEEKIELAIKNIVNAYNCFSLPKFWGSGKRVAADGTKWDLYEQNLLSEYHIRYGGYGGIGYYHVSDTYIALFSHFIPCGVWEAVYILDAMLKNDSDIQPDTIHADTQGQNSPVFALSFLLGIDLMPRIRNWKDITLYRPSKNAKYEHIDELFSDTIDWNLIETHFPDMLRVALSIKAGKITPSTVLRKLSTYSRKNRLYQAFRELGRAIRTGYLMKYIGDEELRSTIQAVTNKSEAFNGFTKWVSFGGDGIIAENNRDQQRKIIKYNHLVSNCIIFYNVFHISQILQELIMEGYKIEDDTIEALSLYINQHINRFGRYNLDLNRRPPNIDYNLSLAMA
ncbi:Tn3 family transposase [Desulfosporosinus nitroreducens]|uniref:Tn3 family transposase n=1 Tax=Desulfosporosinus nitroreducens TaxID=2018668 RepID=A0ABT8QXF3_9FIRM|nr:Tn3 family transposase [Desulfosporosinus nitroreducens]MDO0826031.1 Tn3 family transposase [Desulfosporosinus nitroreducens]